MKKYIVVLILLLNTVSLFSQDDDICLAFLKDELNISGYSIIQVPNIINNIKTYICYDEANNIIPITNISEIFFIKNGVIISIRNDKVFQYISINEKGIIRTKDAILYDFSEPGYEHFKFKGWLLNITQESMNNKPLLSCDFQLTNNAKERIAADPPLSCIYLYTNYNYPIVYNISYDGLKIRASWHENKIITMARGGLLKESELFEPQMAYDEINNLSEKDKRILRNALFALYGYRFVSEDLNLFFSKFFWYQPNQNIENDINLLDENQRRLLDYLLKSKT